MFRYEGKLYRAINPIYAREPLSGRGAELYGGRFNPKGVAALYASLSIMTALREANQVACQEFCARSDRDRPQSGALEMGQRRCFPPPPD